MKNQEEHEQAEEPQCHQRQSEALQDVDRHVTPSGWPDILMCPYFERFKRRRLWTIQA